MGTSTLTDLSVSCVPAGTTWDLLDDFIEPPLELVSDSLMDMAAFTFHNHLFLITVIFHTEFLLINATT
jgi:hypothetical protein